MNTLVLTRVIRYLRQKYEPLRELIKNELPNANDAQIDTQVLVGHVLKYHCKISDETMLYRHITDGPHDRGIDGLYFDESNHKLTLIQAKFSETGKNTAITERDAGEFANGIREIIMSEIFSGRVNEKILKLQPEIENFLDDFGAKVEIITVTTSEKPLSQNAQKRIDRILKDIKTSPDAESDRHLHIGLDLLHDSMHPAELSQGADFELELMGAQAIIQPYIGHYGYMSGHQIAQLVDQNGDAIFAKNLRKALGNSSVNQDIVRTALEDAENFWYFNNGITMVAEGVAVARRRGDRALSRLRLSNGSIVNGAQTASSLHSLYPKEEACLETVKCLVRIIHLPEDDPEFARNVTRWNNSQNAVGAKDFVSLDPFQVKLRKSLNDSYGIVYTIRSGDDIDHDVTNEEKITLQEATLGLVCCGQSVENVVRAKSYISGIWRDTDADPYLTVFDRDRVNENVIVKAVDLLRFVDAFLARVKTREVFADSDNNLFSGDKMRQLATHGNRLFCHYIMSRFNFFQDRETRSQFEQQYLVLDLEAEFIRFSDVVFGLFPNSYLARLFKNSKKSKEIINELERRSQLSVHG